MIASVAQIRASSGVESRSIHLSFSLALFDAFIDIRSCVLYAHTLKPEAATASEGLLYIYIPCASSIFVCFFFLSYSTLRYIPPRSTCVFSPLACIYTAAQSQRRLRSTRRAADLDVVATDLGCHVHRRLLQICLLGPEEESRPAASLSPCRCSCAFFQETHVGNSSVYIECEDTCSVRMSTALVNTTTAASLGYDDLPIDMRFNAGHVVSIVTYSILMIISAVGNITVLALLLRRRGNAARTRINTMLIHLAIADLLVTFLMMPLEIGWAATVSWKAGDAMCRIMSFFRMFGLYLSSFILICISVDRYHAVLRPLQMIDIDRRGRFMIAGSWICSALCSAPQMVVFHVEAHPTFTWYEQCITFNTFPSFTHELTYSLFGMVMMYWFPLIVIIYTYTSILAEMYRRSKDTTSDRIRRSSLGFLGRARVRTLKMTIIIVLVFFICWTPYYVMSLWYWIDSVTATKVDLRIQKALFLFACTNSCMNPIVYGAFNIRKGNKDVSTSHKIITCSSKGSANEMGCRASWQQASTRSDRRVRIQTQIILVPSDKFDAIELGINDLGDEKIKNNVSAL